MNDRTDDPMIHGGAWFLYNTDWLYLYVLCDYCGSNGCQRCHPYQQMLRCMKRHPLYLAWWQAVGSDRRVLPALADWLEREGFGFWTESVRFLGKLAGKER